jgi:hypothetical protein
MDKVVLADKIRETMVKYNNLVMELDELLRDARSAGIEIDLLDGTNTEVSHDLDGLSPFKLRIVKMLARTPL